MSKTHYLISVDFRGGVSYRAQGTRHAMKKLSKEPWHRITTISHPDKAKQRYGINS